MTQQTAERAGGALEARAGSERSSTHSRCRGSQKKLRSVRALVQCLAQVSMIPAELLGTLEKVVRDAVRVGGTYKKRSADSQRAFGGVNVVMCADFWQLHPVTGTFLASNPLDVPAGCAQRALELLWLDGDDSVRSFWELTELMRCDDTWYNSFLGQCRIGNLSAEDYCYFHGLPTLKSPCASKCRCNDDVTADAVLGPHRKSWKERFLKGCADMAALQTSPEGECAECRAERARRRRVLTDTNSLGPELHRDPFSGAPALYTFNVPRYFATNLRAREFAKQKNLQLSWCYARDVPLHPGDRDLPHDKMDAKLFSWLRRHDQETGHIPSIYPLAVGMPIRLTENVDRGRQLFRGRKGVIYGWTMAPGCVPEEIDGEFILDALPLVIYIHFPDAKWRIGKLPEGVYPFEAEIQNLESQQAHWHRSTAHGLLDAPGLRVHRAHDPRGHVGGSFRGPAALVQQGVDDVSDCRVRLPVQGEATYEHLRHAAVFDFPLRFRQPRGARATCAKAFKAYHGRTGNRRVGIA